MTLSFCAILFDNSPIPKASCMLSRTARPTNRDDNARNVKVILELFAGKDGKNRIEMNGKDSLKIAVGDMEANSR